MKATIHPDEIHEFFWNEIKEPLLKSAQHAKTNQKLGISQRQDIIKLLVKNIFTYLLYFYLSWTQNYYQKPLL